MAVAASPRFPDFFIVGAPRCGTTSAWEFLRDHPDVFVPKLKEPKYFSAPDYQFPHRGPGDAEVDARVVASREDYERLFAASGSAKAVGEASVDYLSAPGAAARIRAAVPDAKVLVFLREPAARAYSSWSLLVASGRERLPFDAALEAEPSRRAGNWEFIWRYRELGLYADQIERYQRELGRDRVHVFLWEELDREPIGTAERLLQVLALPAHPHRRELPRSNRSHQVRWPAWQRLVHSRSRGGRAASRLVPAVARRWLREVSSSLNRGRSTNADLAAVEKLRKSYGSDVSRLEQLLNRDLSAWVAPG